MDRNNTIFGWLLFAGIVGLGLSILSGKYFHANNPERPEVMGFIVEGVEDTGGEEEVLDIGLFLANADVAAGEQAAISRCGTCHTFNQGGANGTGPNLWGVMGASIGKHSPSFAYSSVLSEMGGVWSYENMDAWLTSPRAFASGTKMSFAGLGKPQDRANIAAYMQSMGGGPDFPAPLPEEEEAPAAEAVNDEDGMADPAAMEAEALATQPVEEAAAE